MRLTDRDEFVVRSHVHTVRCSAQEHLLAALWPPTEAGRKNGQRRLHALWEADLLDRHVVHVKNVRAVCLLHAGQPDDPAPDCAELSRQCRAAWNALPIRAVVVYTATRRARLIFGGRERHRVHALPQLSHDLGCSASYFHLLRTEPDVAACWRSEDDGLLPAGFGDCQPDAVLVDADERPTGAIEFAAHYGTERFQRLLKSFADSDRPLAYRIYGAQP